METNPDIIFDKLIQTKMLILFVMSRLTRPIAMDMLTELTLCDERISYFDVTECIHKLVKTKHLYLTDNKYSLTAKGLRNGKILGDDLPYSVKVKAEQAASRINDALNRDSQITTRRDAEEKGGFKVVLSLADGMSEILSVTLHTANEQQAEKLENGFRKNAQSMYHNIIELITRR